MTERKRRVLEMLAASGPCGRTDPRFLAGFSVELLDLVHDGLATVWPGRVIDAVCVRITDEGRSALDRA
jgi:hypothetical protein